MRVAIVVQRYGINIVGGAQFLARKLAEKLTMALGWEIEVFTTTAADCRTWKSECPEGVEIVNNIKVRRYRPERGRNVGCRIWQRIVIGLYSMFSRLPAGLEMKWFECQGPVVPRLIDDLAAEASGFDRILCFTYCHLTTLEVINRLPSMCYVVPRPMMSQHFILH